MGNKNLKKRNEIDNKYKWNIEAMYQNLEKWEEDVAEINTLTDNFVKFEGHITESASLLLNVLRARDDLWQKVEKVYVYAKMKLDEDNTVSVSQESHDKALGIMAKVSAATSFFTPELLSADEEVIKNYMSEESGLAQYKFLIEATLREKEHILTSAEENILAQLSEVTGAPDAIYSMLSDAELKFGEIVDEDGDKVTLTHGNYINFMQSKNRSVRESAFTHMYEAYKKYINTIATTYSYNVKNDCINARIRKYSSARAAALSDDNISEEVYDNLVQVVHDYLPVMHKYISLRKEKLGVDELKMYDVYVPMVDVPEKKVSFDEAKEIMLKALSPLGDEYLNQVRKGIAEGWIDVYENEGKTSGAYSFGSYDSFPYILLNYTESLQDVFTLVHEMGHSMHSSYTRSNQPFTYGDYSIFTAEVASTVNECLLTQYLLNNETDPEMKKYLINMNIEAFRTTLFRQTMFAEFEQIVHKYVEDGGSLTSEWLCNQYETLNKAYFGDAMSNDPYIRYEWARIPHFYRSFYVYQYATGYSAASAISDKILTEGEPARDAYIDFLKSGGSNYPVELLKIAGVDMSQKEPVLMAMKTFEKLVEEFESLL